MRVYLDNSATSFPKPQEVINSMVEYMSFGGSNISRSMSSQALDTGSKIFMLRESVKDFFNAPSSRNVIFTKNITESLNIVIKGFIKKGDSVMISSLEHNAVTRPLTQQGANIIAIPVSSEGKLDLDFAKNNIGKVKLVICTHASNVSGDIMPIEKLAEICRENAVSFVLDSAQSAGVLNIDMSKTPIDCVCFTGHKALLGPSGTGGLVIVDSFAEKIPSFITGGTGSMSNEEVHPDILPDKYEAGTQNIVGLIGLYAGINFVKEKGLSNIFDYEKKIGQAFFEMLSRFKEIKIIGSNDYGQKLPVFSLDFLTKDNADVSYILANEYQIDNRPGLHCAPRAHQTYGTYPHGTVRLSLSHYTTMSDLEYATNAISEILNGKTL